MNDSELFLLLADIVLTVHFLIVAFIVLGFAAILGGRWLGWRWIQNRGFRTAHLAAIAIVILQAWLGRLCALTTVENALRQKAGEPGYAETFIQHWLHKVLFFEAEAWVFTAIYSVFGALVVAVWIWDRRKHRSR